LVKWLPALLRQQWSLSCFCVAVGVCKWRLNLSWTCVAATWLVSNFFFEFVVFGLLYASECLPNFHFR
jgi:hypothetical protein